MKNAEDKQNLVVSTTAFAVFRFFIGGALTGFLVCFGFGSMNWGAWQSASIPHPLLGWSALALAFILWFPASSLVLIRLHHGGEYHELIDTFAIPILILQAFISGHIEARVWRALRRQR